MAYRKLCRLLLSVLMTLFLVACLEVEKPLFSPASHEIPDLSGRYRSAESKFDEDAFTLVRLAGKGGKTTNHYRLQLPKEAKPGETVDIAVDAFSFLRLIPKNAGSAEPSASKGKSLGQTGEIGEIVLEPLGGQRYIVQFQAEGGDKSYLSLAEINLPRIIWYSLSRPEILDEIGAKYRAMVDDEGIITDDKKLAELKGFFKQLFDYDWESRGHGKKEVYVLIRQER
jgi:hypothetical protein